MNLIMITPRVGISNPLLSFIPTWITHLAQKLDRLWVITPRAEVVPLPYNAIIYEVGRDYQKDETLLHAARNYHQVIWRLTQQEKVDGIFTHMYPLFAILASPYARLHRIPLVLWYTHTYVNWQLRLANMLVARIITASEGSCRLNSDKVKVLGHGIDLNQFTPLPANKETIHKGWKLISVGRISPSKHYEIILEAIQILVEVKGYTEIQLVIIGDAPNDSQLDYAWQIRHSELETRGLSAQVTFLGTIPHPEIHEYLQQADIFISASETGLDKAVLEAMACGVIPLVSLDEFRPTLGVYADRLMYSPRCASDLADRIEMILKLDRARLEDLKKAMPLLVKEHHDIDGLMQKIIRVFTDLSTSS
jgi:glycosyltransferase involved in cell wall biosynthesis